MHYKMNAIARLTGFRPDLLRSWERRHGLLEPERTDGGHRLYTDDDLTVLLEVGRLLARGRSIGAVALEGRVKLLAAGRRAAAGAEEVSPAPSAPERRPLSSQELQSVIASLVRAAVQVDHGRFVLAMRSLRATENPRRYVPAVLAPVGIRIGELWQEGVCSAAGEHMASAVIGGCLVELLGQEIARPRAADALRIACAGVPGERHENAGLLWALHQTWLGHRVSWLGVDLPFGELDHACEQLAPHEIHLTVTLERTLSACRADLTAFERRWAGRARVRVGGHVGRAEHGADPASIQSLPALSQGR